ncbi:MAG TPA: hypothetical protein G4N94_10225 [Caldilineae bacterium]|nr:hypothetical protein [Caldilineae bacterium]
MLLIIGLDGADWRILDPWLEQGALPHLAALRARGTWGDLRSTIRPESSIAWSTFATGVDPGRHGIFSFSAQRPESYDIHLNTATSIQRATFWQHAATTGKRIALLNVPMTYPPQPFAGGALVAGMLTPSLRSPFTHPPELQAKLLAAIPDYTINVEQTGLNLQRFIRYTTQAIQARRRAALWLLQGNAWDAVVVVFTATDRLQHYTLHLLHPDHPRYDLGEAERLIPELLAAYQAVDQAVGELVQAAGADATILLLSDHGFAPCARAFLPNAWLEQQGLLSRRPSAAPSSGLWRRLRANPTLRRMKNALPLLRDVRRPPTLGAHLAAVDWPRTQAVYSPTGGIRLNVRGREPQGALSSAAADRLATALSAALLDIVDPATGQHPIQSVHRREELYHGPYVSHAPDLIIEPRRADANPAHNTIHEFDFGSDFLRSSGDFTGNHALDGIVMAVGPGIPVGRIKHARLLDMAPTILHALDLPLPPGLDGDVLPFWSESQEIKWLDSDESPAPGSTTDHALDNEEAAAVEQRLRSLGYL